MSLLVKTCFQELPNFIRPVTNSEVSVRHKVRKVMGCGKNSGNVNPKHRGVKIQDGGYVHAGGIIVTQRKPRFHPGLHVGMGSNGTLFALEHGKVAITCEIINPDLNHYWARKNYKDRIDQIIYKKHINVLPEKQHDRFILKDAI